MRLMQGSFDLPAPQQIDIWAVYSANLENTVTRSKPLIKRGITKMAVYRLGRVTVLLILAIIARYRDSKRPFDGLESESKPPIMTWMADI